MNLKEAVYDAVKVMQTGEGADKLDKAEKQIKKILNKKLGGVDIFGTKKEWAGGLVRTVADKNSVSVMFHLGGVLQPLPKGNDRIYYRIKGGCGGGRAFKFLAHTLDKPVVKEDFFGVEFPYLPDMITLSAVTGGTIARVRHTIQRTFVVDTTCRVTTAGAVEDMRVFLCGEDLVNMMQLLFGEMISGVDGEWDDFSRLLHT